MVSKQFALLFIFALALALAQALAQTSSSSGTEVQYPHLAFTGDPTSMMFSWYTDDNTTTSECQVGTESGVYTFQGTGSSTEWKEGKGIMHNAIVTGLTPSTQYYYVCGDPEGGYSDPNYFTTAPADNVPFSIGLYGDMGTERAHDTMKKVNDLSTDKKIDWVYHVGDISYADDQPDFQYTWNQWFELMAPTLNNLVYMVIPGNHEFIADADPVLYDATKYFKVYNVRFNMPSYSSNGSTNMWYSFDYSYVHFISIDTETDYPGAVFGNHFGDQLAWLEKDLEAATSSPNRKPWIIVGGHRPMYSSDHDQSNATDGAPMNTPDNTAYSIQQSFEDLFHKYGVDLYFTGHVHSYERTYPVYQNTVTSTSYINPQGLVEVVIGCAGSIEGLSDKDPSHWNDPQPTWSAYRYGDGFGYGVLDIFNASTLSWKFYKSDDDTLMDSFVIVKDASL